VQWPAPSLAGCSASATRCQRLPVLQASERRGVLVAFIILDNPAASLLDMRTVSFVDGKPVFAQVQFWMRIRIAPTLS
jgi:hypothetical protein